MKVLVFCVSAAVLVILIGCFAFSYSPTTRCFDSNAAITTVKVYCEKVELEWNEHLTPKWRIPDTIPQEVIAAMNSLDQYSDIDYTPFLLALLIRTHAGQTAEYGGEWTTFPILPLIIKQKIDSGYPLALYPIHDRSSLEYMSILKRHPDVFNDYPVGQRLLMETENEDYVDRCKRIYSRNKLNKTNKINNSVSRD